MKLNKVLILLVAIAFGMTACNSDDVPVNNGAVDTDTYASITVKFPGTVGTRALPADFNAQGSWDGRDNLNTVDVFLVNVAKGVVNYNSFTKSAFAEIDAAGILKPNLALKATAGENVKVYVVINGEASILTTLRTTSAANFATAFTAEASKIASQVASYVNPVAPATTGKETIMMTNDADSYTIAVVAGVTETQAKDGTANHAQVQVERVVSRAMLTVAPEATAGAGWPVSAMIGGVETQIAKVTGVTYAVGQSNTKFYIMKKADYSTPDPVYTFVPTDLAAWTAGNTNLDYTGLANFTTAQQFTYDAAGVSAPLSSEATSKFVLPVNHSVASDPVAGRPFYKKGNTTYFEIRAAFMPLSVDGAAPTFTVPTTVYLGQNDNKFYSTRALAEAQGQKATEYTDGIMKYVLWLNPNSTNATVDPNPMVSPTVRNRVYHAHIDAFLRMGVANNPLNPTDVNDPLDPENPIKPFDPLKTDITYLSVSVKVLPWTIHSYKISLSDDMY